MSHILGIDIGGSGIKAAPIDTDTGQLLARRYRVKTPNPSKPDSVFGAAKAIQDHFDWKGPVGCAFPGVVRNGIVLTAANVHKSWLGADAVTGFSDALDAPVTVLNDADAAGLAEVRFGAAQRDGVVIVLTLGTGIGSAVFVDRKLVPNTELGHLRLDGREAEQRASARAKEEGHLGWRKWSKQLRSVLSEIESLLWPDLFVLGGGISKDFDAYCSRLKLRTPVLPAKLLNDAGIVGAALAADV